MIDQDTCIHLQYGDRGICNEVCEAKAIDYEHKAQTRELKVGAIVAAPGYAIFDARIKRELGNGRLPNLVSALEFERILSASGPYSGHVLRPSDKQEPRRIALIQCVGSRDFDRDYCSSVCRRYAAKQATIVKEHART